MDTSVKTGMWNANLKARGLGIYSENSPTRSGVLTEQQASELKNLEKQVGHSVTH